MNIEEVKSSFENLERKYKDFKILLSNISDFHYCIANFTNSLTISLDEMNNKINYHTEYTNVNTNYIGNFHNIKNDMLSKNSTLNKHIRVCNQFLISKAEFIEEKKMNLGQKKENCIDYIINLLNKKNIKNSNNSISENYDKLKSIKEELYLIDHELNKYFEILRIYYDKYLMSTFIINTNNNNNNNTDNNNLQESFSISMDSIDKHSNTDKLDSSNKIKEPCNFMESNYINIKDDDKKLINYKISNDSVNKSMNRSTRSKKISIFPKEEPKNKNIFCNRFKTFNRANSANVKSNNNNIKKEDNTKLFNFGSANKNYLLSQMKDN